MVVLIPCTKKTELASSLFLIQVVILSSDDENETVIWIESESEKEDGDIMVLAESDEGRDTPEEELAEENHEPVTTGSVMTQASVG